MANDLPTNTKKVLLVDDDPISLKLMQLIIQDAGFSVSTADDGRTALESLEWSVPDIIVTDISMADIDGLELIRTIRRMESDLPILVLSGMQSKDVYLDAAEVMGANAVLSKPIDREQLVHSVRKLLGMGDV